MREKNSNKNELNLNKGNSTNFINSESESKNGIQKEIKNNIALNYFAIKNEIEDNSSATSGKNQNSNNNNRASLYSSSSISKNFVLKSEICKSTRNTDKNYNKNNNYNNNPIMNYFNLKNFGNFYLFADKKSQDDIEGNQFLNFFPMEPKESQRKEKDIMRCIYADRKFNKNIKEILRLAELFVEFTYQSGGHYYYADLDDLRRLDIYDLKIQPPLRAARLESQRRIDKENAEY